MRPRPSLTPRCRTILGGFTQLVGHAGVSYAMCGRRRSTVAAAWPQWRRAASAPQQSARHRGRLLGGSLLSQQPRSSEDLGPGPARQSHRARAAERPPERPRQLPGGVTAHLRSTPLTTTRLRQTSSAQTIFWTRRSRRTRRRVRRDARMQKISSGTAAATSGPGCFSEDRCCPSSHNPPMISKPDGSCTSAQRPTTVTRTPVPRRATVRADRARKVPARRRPARRSGPAVGTSWR